MEADENEDIASAEDAEWASPDQFAEALAGLSHADVKRLDQIAGFLWNRFKLQGRSGGPKDLLQEALCRTLEGERHWPYKRVKLLKFLDRTMESIASSWVQAAVSEEQRHGELSARCEEEREPAAKEGQSSGAVKVFDSAETELMVEEQWREIEELFADHPRALEIFKLKVDNWTASEIQSELGIDSREWERERKRIQRMVARYVKQSGE